MEQLDETPFYCANCIGSENKGLEYNKYLDRVGNKWRKGECLCDGFPTVQMVLLHQRKTTRKKRDQNRTVTVVEFPISADDHKAIYKVPEKDKRLRRLRAKWADPQFLRSLEDKWTRKDQRYHGDKDAIRLQDRATRSWKKKGYVQFFCPPAYCEDEPYPGEQEGCWKPAEPNEEGEGTFVLFKRALVKE